MNPALTPFEILAMLALAAYLCAPALKRLFAPEIQRARTGISRTYAAPVNDAQESVQAEATPHEPQEKAPRAIAHPRTRPEELRVALTRSCADALLAALQGGHEGAPKTAGGIDSKLAEALRPGSRTIRIEVGDFSQTGNAASADESSATGQRMFVVRSAAAGEVRVSSPWEYLSEPDGVPGKRTPATIWSAHSNFLGLRPATRTPIAPPSAEATVADGHWTPRRLARRT